MTHLTGFQRATRRALATFVFATTGQLIGLPLLDMDVAAWKPVAAAELDALVNLAYRWAEPIVRSDNPVDVKGR